YKTGFVAARGDIIVTMDGDGTYPPDSLPLLLYVLVEEKLDFITARRWYSRSDQAKSPIRLLGNAVLSGAMMCLFFKFIIDSQSGMWVFRRDVLRKIQPRSDSMALSEELKILAFTHPGLRCLEMPIYYGERIGTSKLNIWRDGCGNLVFLARMRLVLGRRRPARGRRPGRRVGGGGLRLAPRPRLPHRRRRRPLRGPLSLAALRCVLPRAHPGARRGGHRLLRPRGVRREPADAAGARRLGA